MGGTSAQTQSERVLEQPSEPPLPEGHTSRSGEGRIEHPFKLTDYVSPTPHDSPLSGGYTPGSDKGSLKLEELMVLCTTLANRVTTLENKLLTTKAVYHKTLITLTKRVKKLKTQLKQKRSKAVIHSLNEEEPSVDIEDSPKQGRMIKELDKDEDVNLVKTLLNIRRSSAKDKGKGIMQETELPKKLKKKEMIQLSLNEDLAQKLYAEELAKESARQDQERVWDQVYTFVPKDSKIEKEVMKRARFDLQQGSSKKQRLDQQTEQTEETKEEVEAQGDSDQEIEEMKLYMRIIPDEDISIDVIPLATKPLVIVEYKIVKEGKISTYLTVRADGSTKRVMFEPDVESEVWTQLQGHDVKVWKLFSSSGVHFVRFKNLHIFLLVDKVYPFTHATITKMLERKLQADQ
nr:hypothetical protein [Tanacetum cinerariifolium]